MVQSEDESRFATEINSVRTPSIKNDILASRMTLRLGQERTRLRGMAERNFADITDPEVFGAIVETEVSLRMKGLYRSRVSLVSAERALGEAFSMDDERVSGNLKFIFRKGWLDVPTPVNSGEETSFHLVSRNSVFAAAAIFAHAGGNEENVVNLTNVGIDEVRGKLGKSSISQSLYVGGADRELLYFRHKDEIAKIENEELRNFMMKFGNFLGGKTSDGDLRYPISQREAYSIMAEFHGNPDYLVDDPRFFRELFIQSGSIRVPTEGRRKIEMSDVMAIGAMSFGVEEVLNGKRADWSSHFRGIYYGLGGYSARKSFRYHEDKKDPRIVRERKERQELKLQEDLGVVTQSLESKYEDIEDINIQKALINAHAYFILYGKDHLALMGVQRSLPRILKLDKEKNSNVIDRILGEQIIKPTVIRGGKGNRIRIFDKDNFLAVAALLVNSYLTPKDVDPLSKEELTSLKSRIRINEISDKINLPLEFVKLEEFKDVVKLPNFSGIKDDNFRRYMSQFVKYLRSEIDSGKITKESLTRQDYFPALLNSWNLNNDPATAERIRSHFVNNVLVTEKNEKEDGDVGSERKKTLSLDEISAMVAYGYHIGRTQKNLSFAGQTEKIVRLLGDHEIARYFQKGKKVEDSGVASDALEEKSVFRLDDEGVRKISEYDQNDLENVRRALDYRENFESVSSSTVPLEVMQAGLLISKFVRGDMRSYTSAEVYNLSVWRAREILEDAIYVLKMKRDANFPLLTLDKVYLAVHAAAKEDSEK